MAFKFIYIYICIHTHVYVYAVLCQKYFCTTEFVWVPNYDGASSAPLK